jgi:hypothetical protein
MLIPDTYVKQPSQRKYVAIALALQLAEGDTLSSITECKCYDPNGADVTSAMIDSPVIDGSDVNMWIQAGTDGKTYDLTLKVHTTQGADLEEDLIIVVREAGHA